MVGHTSWRPVTIGLGPLPPGARVLAISRQTNWKDLFGVCNDGNVYTAYYDPAVGWRGPRSISFGSLPCTSNVLSEIVPVQS